MKPCDANTKRVIIALMVAKNFAIADNYSFSCDLRVFFSINKLNETGIFASLTLNIHIIKYTHLQYVTEICFAHFYI